MAFTISVDLASKEDIFDTSLLNRESITYRSVSSKVLQDVLGGDVDGLGYLKTTGDTISGRLIVSSTPVESFNVANKSYVDSHALLRKYIYECKQNPTQTGEVNEGSNLLSGADIYNNYFYYFNRGDTSFNEIYKYIDVYRDGILQSLGTDYSIINNFGGSGLQGITALNFFEPFELGTKFQINIGNVGAYPLTYGVRSLSGTIANRFYKKDGYISNKTLSSFYVAYLDVKDFATTSAEVSAAAINNKYVSPATLSAFPLVPRATGLFRKDESYTPDYPPPKYGNAAGNFTPITNYKILSVISDPYNNNLPQIIRVVLPDGVLVDNNYNASVTIKNKSFSPDDVVFNLINTETKTTSSFEFFVYDFFNTPPFDIHEISIMVY